MNIAQNYYHWRKALERGDFSMVRFAKEISAGTSTVERWIAGKGTPRGMSAAAIERQIRKIEQRETRITGGPVKMPRP